MKAAVWYGPGRANFRLEEVPTPEIEQPDDVIIRVHSVYYGAKVVRAITVGHPELKAPAIMGRMIAGEVVAVGTGIHTLSEGMRVTVDPDAPCGSCYYCRNLEPVHCLSMAQFSPGGMAEYTRIRGRLLDGVHLIPAHISYDEAAFTESLTCVASGLLKANVIYGDTVVILGCGGLGLAHVQMARLRGASQIFLSGTHTSALKIARTLEAYPVDARKEDLRQVVLDATQGRGADVVVEAVGRSSTYEAAIQLVRPGGCVIAFGGCPPGVQITLSPNDLHYRSIRFVGAYHYTPGLFGRTLSLICTRAVDLRPILTHTLPLSLIGEAIDIFTQPDCRTLALHPCK